MVFGRYAAAKVIGDCGQLTMFGNPSEIGAAYGDRVRWRMAFALFGISVVCGCSSPSVKVTTLDTDAGSEPLSSIALDTTEGLAAVDVSTPETAEAVTTVPPAVASVAGSTSDTSKVSGTVTDSSGHPIANAIVTGLVSLESSPTDSAGHFVLRCHGEPLVASSWELPLLPPNYGAGPLPLTGPIPIDQGPGYAFSGGASDVATASIAACDGVPVDFVIGGGGTVDIVFDPSLLSLLVIDNLYLPGLGEQSSIVIPPISSDGHQRISRLAAGVLRIDGAMATLSCSGPGVSNDASIAGATVVVVPGETVNVSCTQSVPASG
jgi:hypothetical protein